jgi:hypothetical protein
LAPEPCGSSRRDLAANCVAPIPGLASQTAHIEHDRIISSKTADATSEIASEPRQPVLLEKNTNMAGSWRRRDGK